MKARLAKKVLKTLLSSEILVVPKGHLLVFKLTENTTLLSFRAVLNQIPKLPPSLVVAGDLELRVVVDEGQGIPPVCPSSPNSEAEAPPSSPPRTDAPTT